MRTISIPITDEIFFALKKDVSNIQQDMRTGLALQYFKEKKLSLGLAAKMADMTKNESER